MSQPDERKELAMQILECRRKLRLVAWDDATVKDIQAEMAKLGQKLRELDEYACLEQT